MSDKGCHENSNLYLLDNGTIVKDEMQISAILNEYYVNITKHLTSKTTRDSIDLSAEALKLDNEQILEKINDKYENHLSVKDIRDRISESISFSFAEASACDIIKMIRGLDPKSATGFDTIPPPPPPPKLVILSSDVIAEPLPQLINVTTIDSHLFPTCEKVIIIMPFFDKIQSGFLSAYRTKYSSQHVLLRLVEGWRQYLDDNKLVGAILMDLSKAFDCLLHDLLIAKLQAYGLERESLLLLMSYLQDRKQCVKIKGLRGLLKLIKAGVPQESMLGPIFINDIYYVLQSDLHNFADDNTVSAVAETISELVKSLEDKANVAIEWFHVNEMIVNPGKFKSILLSKSRENLSGYQIKLRGHEIETKKNLLSINVLGVTIDSKLSFEKHISQLCQQASSQLYTLERLGFCMDREIRQVMVQSFILAHFNYCPLVWYFTSARQVNKIEKVQERAFRLISSDYFSDYESLLEKLKFVCVQIRRIRSLCVETVKSLNDLNAPCMKELFIRNESTYNLRSYNDLSVPRVNQNTFGLRSIRYEGSLMWNHLPNNIKNACNIEMFEKAYQKLEWSAM